MKKAVFVDEGVALCVLVLQSLRLQGTTEQDISVWMSELREWIFEDSLESGVMYTAFIIWRPTLKGLLEWLSLRYCNKPLKLLEWDDVQQYEACLKSLERDLEDIVGRPVSLTGAFRRLLQN